MEPHICWPLLMVLWLLYFIFQEAVMMESDMIGYFRVSIKNLSKNFEKKKNIKHVQNYCDHNKKRKVRIFNHLWRDVTPSWFKLVERVKKKSKIILRQTYCILSLKKYRNLSNANHFEDGSRCFLKTPWARFRWKVLWTIL